MEHVRGSPGDSGKQRRVKSRKPYQVITPIGRRTNDNVILIQRMKCGLKVFDSEQWAVCADEHQLSESLVPLLVECLRQAFAQIVPLLRFNGNLFGGVQ